MPGAPLDNNLCERALKKAILHRKNSLFYRTLNGAKVGDLFMSLIHTAELHHVEPFDYLVALLRHEAAVTLDPAAWMPWNYTTTPARLATEPTVAAPVVRALLSCDPGCKGERPRPVGASCPAQGARMPSPLTVYAGLSRYPTNDRNSCSLAGRTLINRQ